ncbi:hypothetical protein [Clostridium sp. ZBS13]|uniref:hypothetical protein n=1 Tax=Clostridium sp. ZBS13 TaxID=2949971 RepID=UPI0020794642|nr:hypothetical protein [Clostridium sp. ZBS13]
MPSITILDTPAMVEQPNNVEVFPEQRVDVPIIIDFPAEKQNETGNIIFIDGVSEAENILKKGYDPILADKSIAARDAKVAEIQAKSKSQQQKYITVVGGYNIETGEVAVGVKNTATDYKKCAENLVVEQLGGDPSKVIMTPAIRPRNNATIPVCKYCQEKYSTSNFIPGTTFGGD